MSVLDCTDDLADDDDDDDDDDDENEKGWTAEDEEEFHNEMDKNGDGMLNRDEIYQWLVPTDFDHIVDESNHLFSEADDDKVCLSYRCLIVLILVSNFSCRLLNVCDVVLLDVVYNGLLKYPRNQHKLFFNTVHSRLLRL